MKNRSDYLFIALITTICIFSLVVLFKQGTHKKKQEPIVTNKEKGGRKPAIKSEWQTSEQLSEFPKISDREIKQDKPNQIIDHRGPIEPLMKIEKDDSGRTVVSNEILLTLDPKISIAELENIEKEFHLNLLYFNPFIGFAHFKILSESMVGKKELQKLIPKKYPTIKSIESNVIAKLSLLPEEIGKNAIWYLKNDDRVSYKSLLAIRRGTSIYTWPDTPVIKNVDIFWGQVTDTNDPWKNPTLSCALPGGPLVAIVDAGGDPLHPELFNRLDLNLSTNVSCPHDPSDTFISAYFDLRHKNCYQNSTDLEQLHNDLKLWIDRQESEFLMGHGLMVTSVIAANATGQMALGVCPAGKIFHVMIGKLTKAVDSQNIIQSIGHTITSADSVIGIVEATNRGARIINTSWTIGAPNQLCEGKYAIDCSILQAIRYARTHGAMIVAAAGNSSMNIDTQPVAPASLASEWDNPNNEFAHLVSVGGSSPNGEKWINSNFAAKSVTLSAPANKLAVLKFSNEYVTTLASSYGNVGELDPRNDTLNDVYWGSGTSGAAPIVSAVSAILYRILYDKFGEFQGTTSNLIYDYPKVITNILYKTARKGGLCQVVVGQDSRFGCLDAQAAIDEAKRLASSNVALATLDVSSMAAGQPETKAVATEVTHTGGGGGGCGWINTDGPSSSSGNWPLFIFYALPFILGLFQLSKIRR